MIGRRYFLAGATALAVVPTPSLAGANEEVELILALLPDRDAAAKLGETWMQAESRRPVDILKSLRRKLGGKGAVNRDTLAAAILDDFRMGRVVKIEGWQIARTQAELCALAYFATVGRR